MLDVFDLSGSHHKRKVLSYNSKCSNSSTNTMALPHEEIKFQSSNYAELIFKFTCLFFSFLHFVLCYSIELKLIPRFL